MPEPVPTVPLIHGAEIPQIGIGTFPLSDDEAEAAVAQAIALGYRSVDTAHNYGNETGVGRGIARSGVPREELFVTTKLNAEWHGRSAVREAFELGTGRLDVDYLDLFMIHWPNPWLDRYVDAWHGLADLLAEGLVRAIGTSNFKPAHLQRLIEETGVVPDVNQIQLSPYFTRAETRAFHAEHGIVTESWAPLGGVSRSVLDDPAIVQMAEEIGRPPAAVVMRWHVQQGLVAIPKSTDRARQAANLDVYGFSLSAEQMDELSALDRGEAATVDSDSMGH